VTEYAACDLVGDDAAPPVLRVMGDALATLPARPPGYNYRPQQGSY
jgi:hypothetical protein